MSVDLAQRRLLEALAALERDSRADGGVGSPLALLAAGIDLAREQAEAEDQPSMARAMAALIDLVAAVQADLNLDGVPHG